MASSHLCSRSLLHAAVEDALTLSASCSGHLLPRLLHREGLFLQDNEPRQTFCLELFLVIDFYHRNQDINKATEGCISHFLNTQGLHCVKKTLGEVWNLFEK